MWSQKTSFSSIYWYFWIYEQNTIFKCELKKRPFSRNVDIFIYGQKTTFSKWSQNNVIFLEILIFTGKKTSFQNDLKKRVYSEMLIVTEIWTKNHFSKKSQDISGYMDVIWFLKMISKYRNFPWILMFSNKR